jgi:5-methylcytosine-specific restriction endonuclease McrA
MLNSSVLVLNLNYEPINVCQVRRAVVLLDKGKAELLENGRGEIHTPTARMAVPSVIRLIYLVRRPFVQRKLTKREIFLRDRFTCQYCGRQTRELTLDHVKPRRQEGDHTWENVVSACIPCNRHKAGHTPAEAGMLLLRRPKAPYPNPYYILYNRTILEEWRKFIPWVEPGLAPSGRPGSPGPPPYP